MYTIQRQLASELAAMQRSGLAAPERLINSPQGTHLHTASGAPRGRATAVNFCANDYLGLANDPRLIRAAKDALDNRGVGMASVRFICGTQDIHQQLEQQVARLLTTEDTILFSSCFDANAGVFDALLDDRDAVVSDALNHASIIDGIRLSKAQRFRYKNRDMADLEEQLRRCQTMNDGCGPRRTVIVTDGVFSMDGHLAPLPHICDLAESHGALVMVDDSHATGVLGATGAGTPEHFGVTDRVDILTGTFGKALGGASGGFVSGPAEIVGVLRQRARPYLFSNSLAPAMVGVASQALELAASAAEPRRRLRENAAEFRRQMTQAGFTMRGEGHPIIAVMFHDAVLTARMAEELLSRGVYVTAFSHPVVPRDEARIRVQISAQHTPDDITTCVQAFVEAHRAVLDAAPRAVTADPTTESERP